MGESVSACGFLEKLIGRLEECTSVEDYGETFISQEELVQIVNQLAEEYNNEWIPVNPDDVDTYPKTDGYILVSFDNFSLPDIGRYEVDETGGAFYPGDDDKSYVSHGLIVSAWQPLPEPYRFGESLPKEMTNADKIRSMSDEELADAILEVEGLSEKLSFCKNSSKCNDILYAGETIPDGMCRQCLIEWLQAKN